MAKVGTINLGGHNIIGQLGEPIFSAVAFYLSDPAQFDFLYLNERWEVELKSGQALVIARTSEKPERSAILSQGLEQAQRCLDLISFQRRKNILIREAGDRHILLFEREGKLVFQHVDISSLGMSVSSEVTVEDKNGNFTLPAAPPPPIWTPGLRFYRLSQTSQDLYEAYRNLFLGFEAILDALCPKRPRERESKWLLRAIRHAGNTVNLNQFVPSNCIDSASYIFDTQYKRIRCRLFHAKLQSRTANLDLPDPEEIASAYERLIRIWRQIAQECLSIRGGGGGAITYTGFKLMMDNALSTNLKMYFSDNASPASEDDREVSPLGKQVFEFSDVRYLSEIVPGRVSFIGSHPVGEKHVLPIIYRVCSKVNDSLMTIGCVKEGMGIDSVDYFESLMAIRLINLDLPKVVFGSDVN